MRIPSLIVKDIEKLNQIIQDAKNRDLECPNETVRGSIEKSEAIKAELELELERSIEWYTKN